MKYAKVPNAKKPRRVTRFDYGGTTTLEEENKGKSYYYDEYGNLLDHKANTDYADARRTSESVGSGITAGVSAVSPLIGDAIGVVDTIGKGERNKNEATDEYGRYESPNNVGEGTVSGSLFNPARGIIEDFSKGKTKDGLIGIATSGIPGYSAWNRGKQAEQEAKDHNAEINAALAQKKHREDLERSARVLATYPTHGEAGASYYAGFGGYINDTLGSRGVVNRESSIFADGGKLVPLASDASLVKGDTHNQDTNNDGKTGVTLQNNQGQDFAEVEDKEVLVGNKVFSTRLGYNIPALALAKVRGKAEEKKASNSTHTKQTGIRNLEKNDIDVNNLYEHQEEFKRINGIGQPTAKYSGGGEMGDTKAKPNKNYSGYWNTVGNIAGNLTPYIDNFYNASQKYPSIPAPEMNVTAPLETTVNVNPQLNEASDTLKAYSTDIDQNISNSSVGNALKGGMYASTLREKNKILTDKMNTETGLRNAKSLSDQTVNNQNIATRNQYALMNMQRKGELLGMASANVANATGDAVKQVQDARSMALDREKMNLIVKAESMGNDAASYQTWKEVGSKAKKGDSNYDFYKDRMSYNAMSVKAWNDTHPDDAIVLKTK